MIVPIYKVEAYLDRCIRSIAQQTYRNIEIILVDDGSPDGCPGICDAWAEKDARVRVIHKENGGLSDARNAGMAAASGALIAFVDSDDTVEPTFLQALYDALVANGADVAECAVRFVDEAGGTLRLRQAAPVASMDKREALRRLVREDGVCQTVWNKLYRREPALAVPFAVGKCNEDEFWTYQVLDRIERLAAVREPLYNYVQRGSSIIGVGYNIRRLDGLEANFQRMQYLQKYPELAPLTREQVMMMCLWQYQSASRTLGGQEKQTALAYILDVFQKTPPVPTNQASLSLKYRLWLAMFRKNPNLTTQVRNMLRIGM